MDKHYTENEYLDEAERKRCWKSDLPGFVANECRWWADRLILARQHARISVDKVNQLTVAEAELAAADAFLEVETKLAAVEAENTKLRAERDAALEKLSLAKTYTEFAGRPCSLCEYKEGIFIKSCSYHETISGFSAHIDDLASRYADLQKDLVAWRTEAQIKTADATIVDQTVGELRRERDELALKEGALRWACEAAHDYCEYKIRECSLGDRPPSPAAAVLKLDDRLLAALELRFATREELVECVKGGKMGFIMGRELLIDGFKVPKLKF